MSLLAHAHWRGPVNRHALLPGAHIPYGETAAAVGDLTSAAVAANLLDMTALTSWLTGCPWPIILQPHSRLKQNEVALLRQFRGLAVAVPDHQGDQDASGHQGGATLAARTGGHRDPTAKLDCKSTYPSVIVTRQLCFSHQKDILPPYMRWLVSMRDGAKRR